ncbi:UvrD-helicase domain-containing protein [Nonlabens sp.]|uniref:UvrD-helicase domain-containing protein n=1 Tax=Nonlabens sp. TaxID=1888209 RepID=UPI003F6A32F3
MAQSPTTFYSASAGSGKTYTLARDYLTLLFKNEYSNGYRKILAVTFTNKAVGEMKERILEYLHKFTFEELDASVIAIAAHIKQEAGLNDEQFKKKAQAIFNQLLHDYSAFDIVTIDSFNHRILRTFAKDIDLPDNFEVELDSKRLISKAIHNLIARAGKDNKLTQLLVDFSLLKIEEGKSWDIEYDLQDIAKLILNENHYPFLKQLKEKEVEDFLRFRESLYKNINVEQKELTEKAQNLVASLQSNGINVTDFKGGSRSIFNTVIKVSNEDFSVGLETASVRDLIAGDLYPKGKSQEIKDRIDQIASVIQEFGIQYKEQMGTVLFYKNIASSLTPLSLLNELLHEIDQIKITEQIVPIYEFNALLAEQIKDQPAPFIYERLGERYRHYFIDEFQDTSRMQWENLSPLIENELLQQRENQQRGSLMLVGDAKQSIYRFRGGDADQFLRLLAVPDLFMLPKKEETLEFNWRSYDNIIHFNNDFFSVYGDHLNSDVYKTLYKKYLEQKTRSKDGGYIQIDLIAKDFEAPYENEDYSTVYPYHVYQQVLKAQESGFALGEICVLVRANKEGHEIAKYLVEQQMRVVSGDSLLVYASHKVQLLISLMKMIQAPDQQQLRFEFLIAYTKVFKITDIHSFVALHLKVSLLELGKNLLNWLEEDLSSAFAKAALFPATERVADSLGLFQEQDTRLQSFMEFLFEYSTGYEVSLSGFIEHWELKMDKLSVPAAADADAVQIMTIHKSKGLEFPVVIVPHCDKKLDDARNPTGWVPVDEQDYEGFDQVFIGLKKENEFYPGVAPEVYERHLGKAQMDQINTLYVAFTRAREQLYVSAIESEGKTPNYASLLKDFITNKALHPQQEDGYQSAQIGESHRRSEKSETEENEMLEEYKLHLDFDRLTISTRKGMLWASGVSEAIQKGNVLHEYLSLIQFTTDFEKVKKKINRDFSLSKKEQDEMITTISKLIHHPDLIPYYKKGIQVLNEQPILLPSGRRLIPDRVVISDESATVIDYKTGAVLDKHKSQLNEYANLLDSMGRSVSEKLLIYTDTLEIVKWKG